MRKITILGEQSTLAALQAAHPTGNPGEAWIVLAGGRLYLWMPEPAPGAWTSIGHIQGPAGPTGDTGPQGPTEQPVAPQPVVRKLKKIKRAADEIDRSVRYVYYLEERGEIEIVRDGRAASVVADSLDAYIARLRAK